MIGKVGQLAVVHDPTRRRFPIPLRLILKLVAADEYMELSKAFVPPLT
jgi:hypothetical protein